MRFITFSGLGGPKANRSRSDAIHNRAIYLAITAIMALSIVVPLGRPTTARGATPTYSFSDVLGQPNDSTGNPQAGIGTNADGYDYPFAVEVDVTRHHLFVADEDNNRVLVYNLDGDNLLADKTPDYVLGQANFTSNDCNRDEETAANTLCYPNDLSIDETSGMLYVSDGDNNRVLAFDTPELQNGMDASLVLGQSTFLDSDYANTPTPANLRYPSGLAFDDVHNRLFVANSDRVSVFDASSATNGTDADNFIGQLDGTSEDGNCTPVNDSTFCNFIGGVGYDSSANMLYASDSYNFRVLQFDVSSITDGESATHVLGQPDFTTRNYVQAGDSSTNDPRSIEIDPTDHRLYLSDAGWNGANRILVYSLQGLSDGQAAMNVLGQEDFTGYLQNRVSSDVDLHAGANTLAGPYGVALNKDSGQLFVADTFNNRVVIYDEPGYENGEDALDVIGQLSFMGTGENAQSVGPNGLQFPSVTEVDDVHHRLFVADYQNERVLEYNLNSDNQLVDKTPDHVLGQSNFTSTDYDACPWTGGVPNQHSLCFGEGIFGGLAYDSINDHLFVTDGASSRIMIFDTASITNGEDAVAMIGQPDWDNGDCNSGPDGPTAATLCLAGNIALDAASHHLFIADTNNNRVLQYTLGSDNLPGDLGLEATAVIGQPGFNFNDQNADSSVSANGLLYPNGITIDALHHHLYVADTSNSRILQYDLGVDNTLPTESDNAAVAQLGQDSLDHGDCNNNSLADMSYMLCYVNGVSVDSASHELYVADTNNNRIVLFDLNSNNEIDDHQADGVIGQPDLMSSDQNHGNSVNSTGLAYPWGVTVDATAGRLYVADNNNNRIVIYSSAPTDIDSDGVSTANEDAAPNSGDANGDGTLDSLQGDVASMINPVTNTYAVLQTDCMGLTGIQLGAEAGDDAKDRGFDYPVGLMDFYGQGCGSDTTVTQYYYGSFDASKLVLRKWHDGVYVTVAGAVLTNVTMGGQPALKLVYHVIDGGPLDDDGTANGEIHDPAGPALNVAGAPNTGLGSLNAQ